MKKSRTLEEEIYVIGLWFLLIGGTAVLIYFKLILPNVEMPPCVAFSILGLYCPGCGGTRAVEALFHGQIIKSLWYHPLVLYGTVLYGTFMLTHTMAKMKIPGVRGMKFHNWYIYGAVILLFANWIIKNILKLCFGIMM